ncbi:MAG: hypothetical protein ACHQ53_05810 [Polyangiales bacterium]
MTTASATKRAPSPETSVKDEDGSGRFRITGERAGTMLPPREQGAAEEVLSLEALGGMLQLEPPPVPTERPAAGRGTVSGVFAAGEGEAELSDSGLSDLVTSLRPYYREQEHAGGERAELDIADLSLSADNPYLASSLVPPPARSSSVGKLVAVGVGAFALAVGAAFLVSRSASVSAPVVSRIAPKPAAVSTPKLVVSTPAAVAPVVAKLAQPTQVSAPAAEARNVTNTKDVVAPIAVKPAVPTAEPVATKTAEPVAAKVAATAQPSDPVQPAAPEPALAAAAVAAAAPTSVENVGDVALPEAPTREQVIAGFEGVRDGLVQCAGGKHGIVTMATTIANSGRIARAVVEGIFQGTPEGSCMARAARGARFPRFSQQSLNVTYPISL